jgi:hypothetical protein
VSALAPFELRALFWLSPIVPESLRFLEHSGRSWPLVNVRLHASRVRGFLQQPAEFLFGETCLLQNLLQSGCGHIPAMKRHNRSSSLPLVP